MTTTREQLKEILNSPQHAPESTHSGTDGSCLVCPWPLHALPPDRIADAILAAGWQPPIPEQANTHLDN